MARPKKNATVNEEVNTAPVEEKKPARRGRPKKNVEVVSVEAAEAIPVAETSDNEEVKQPAKRGRRKKTETTEEKKETAKRTDSKKEETKQPAKRGRKKKTETVTVEPVREITTIVQYRGHQIEEKDMIKKVEESWKAEGNTAAIESITMYVKPEDGKIYYVVNGLSGSVDLF